ncbi:adapter molecule Crk-like isoform X2 [Ornithodoros turicata]|uniref:adapter molecule Crk-like isoform X2 n=1 Tax=Ornithodoros turicata TaxID=34597 RepID=UPI003138A6B0
MMLARRYSRSWFFGPMSRQEATDLLMAEREVGVFLVRNSTTMSGDLVLCVREDNKVSHYIVNRVTQAEQTRFRIGDQMFPDIPSLLNFYKLHYLDTTPLVKPVRAAVVPHLQPNACCVQEAAKKVERVKAKYDFQGSGDPDDLPFKRGEYLTVISKDEDQWWTARNSMGHTGSIPVPYVEKVDESQQVNDGQNWHRPSSPPQQPPGQGNATQSPRTVPPPTGDPIKYNTPSNVQRKLPARARVKQARVPNAYDKTALKLEVGDIITVTKTNINGQWEGELKGRVGHFPFTHVEFIDSENPDEDEP